MAPGDPLGQCRFGRPTQSPSTPNTHQPSWHGGPCRGFGAQPTACHLASPCSNQRSYNPQDAPMTFSLRSDGFRRSELTATHKGPTALVSEGGVSSASTRAAGTLEKDSTTMKTRADNSSS